MAWSGRTQTDEMRAKCGQAFCGGSAKLLSDLVDLIGIEPMTSSMPWKRAPSCATGPHKEGCNFSIFAVYARFVNPPCPASATPLRFPQQSA